MTLNPDIIRNRCQEIMESLERLHAIAAMTENAFLEDQDARDIASYRLLITIEAALSLCFHIASKKLHSVPQSYADCFAVLAGADIIPDPLAQRLQNMARFRNLLIHVYWQVDDVILFNIIKNDLDDIREFSRSMAALL